MIQKENPKLQRASKLDEHEEELLDLRTLPTDVLIKGLEQKRAQLELPARKHLDRLIKK